MKVPQLDVSSERAAFHASMETSRTVIAVDTLTGMADVGIAVATRDGDYCTVMHLETGDYTDKSLLDRVNELCVEYLTSRVVTAGSWSHRWR